MKFTIKNLQANLEAYRHKVLRNAWLTIISHKVSPGEAALNEYLIKNHRMNLKAACVKLLTGCKVTRDYDNNVIVLFPNKDDDALASLITYGNLELRGSNILKDAFFRDI